MKAAREIAASLFILCGIGFILQALGSTDALFNIWWRAPLATAVGLLMVLGIGLAYLLAIGIPLWLLYQLFRLITMPFRRVPTVRPGLPFLPRRRAASSKDSHA